MESLHVSTRLWVLILLLSYCINSTLANNKSVLIKESQITELVNRIFLPSEWWDRVSRLTQEAPIPDPKTVMRPGSPPK